ncbi:MAG TPA: hypothetical protein VGC15_09505 [Acetobacteraceae bacterium]
MHFSLRLAVPLLLFVLPAAAQTPTSPAPAAPATVTPSTTVAPPRPLSLKDFVALPATQGAVIAAAKEQFQHLPGACPGVVLKPTGQLTMYQRLSIGVDGKPIAGVWSERVMATGCQPERTLNVLTLNHPDGTPEHVALMPGETHADPLTQKSALQYAQAIVAHSPIVANCREIAFTDTHFDGYDGLPSPEVTDGRNNRPWRETWTVAACGTNYTIGLLFTPNAQGTRLSGSNPVKRS